MSHVILRFDNVQLGNHQLSFIVKEGEWWAIYGPDGAGKSTLLGMAVGTLRPWRGRVELFGEDPRRRNAVGRFGYLPQVFAQYEDLTVAETLQFFGNLHGIPSPQLQERMQSLLARVGLASFTQRRVTHLSGGMRKKLALITQMIHNPSLLLLDEPTLGVDPLSRSEIWSFLYHMRREGTLDVVFSTVYAEEAERADRVLILDPEIPPQVIDPQVLESYTVVFLTPPYPLPEGGKVVEEDSEGRWVLISQKQRPFLEKVERERPATLDDWILARGLP